jgi:hypothetical protein
MGAEEVRAIALGAIWPVDWLEEPVLEVCHGTLLSGGLVSMWPIGWALSITLDLTGEPTYRPAIRLRINATSPGRLSLDPLGGGFAYQRMDGSWVDYFGAGDETYAYVEIGERCEWEPLGTAGNFCELFVGHARAGEVDGLTRVLTLTEGATHADTVLASGPPECPRGIPECGQPAPGSPCYGGLRTDVPWIALELLEILGPGTERYRVVIDAAGLSQGTYIGNVIASGACTYCRDVCRGIGLTVVPVAIEPTSWGRIKAAYRE